VKVGRGVSITE